MQHGVRIGVAGWHGQLGHGGDMEWLKRGSGWDTRGVLILLKLCCTPEN